MSRWPLLDTPFGQPGGALNSPEITGGFCQAAAADRRRRMPPDMFSAMRIPVFVGRQAGKVILSGTLFAAEIITALVSSMMSVNPNAQRPLAPGPGNEPP